MKTERNILIAFILNLAFSVFEVIGGILTGSSAILSDAVHDFGDAASIGSSYFLEKKSRRPADEEFTYGYSGYSVIGSLLTTVILLAGSVGVVLGAVGKIITPAEINYDGMIIFAVIGVIVNGCAAFFTRDGDSLNQKAVNLHMLEDVLGWAVVLGGAFVMKATGLKFIDPIMSIGVAVYIFTHAAENLRVIMGIFLEKTPDGIDVGDIKKNLCKVDGVSEVHHVHIWSPDGVRNCATLHVVYTGEVKAVKENVRLSLAQHGISHVTVETEEEGEGCTAACCKGEVKSRPCSHHH